MVLQLLHMGCTPVECEAPLSKEEEGANEEEEEEEVEEASSSSSLLLEGLAPRTELVTGCCRCLGLCIACSLW